MRVFSSVAALALICAQASPAWAQGNAPTGAPTSAPAAPGGMATTPPPPGGAAAADAATDDGTVRDPLEHLNRAVWGFNHGVDKVLLKPVSTVYRTITPRPARQGISHFFANLTEPWSFVNNVLQGHPNRAVRNLGRFVVNSTIGIGGLADNATRIGIRGADEDFGQTLAVWGIHSSTYLVLPIFGPSTIRDGVGLGVGLFADPVGICLRVHWCVNASDTAQLVYGGMQIVSARSDLTESGADTLLANSLDPYATARSAYLQRRAAAIANSDDHGSAHGATGAAGSGDDAGMDAAVRDLQSQGGDQGGAQPSPSQPPVSTAPPASGTEPQAPSTQPPPASAPQPTQPQ